MPPDRDDNAPVELRLSRLAWRMDALERELRVQAKALEALGAAVNVLKLEDEVEAGVKRALEARSPEQAQATADRVAVTGAPWLLTWPQKVGGLIVGGILVFDAVRGYWP